MDFVCRNLYRTVFRDPDTKFEDLLFDNCFCYCHTLEVQNKMVSMLFMLPIEVKFADKSIKGAYLYAAATDLEHRKKGYMSKLIESLIKEYDFVLLRPANDSLISYYAKLGFISIIAGDFLNSPYVIPQDGYKKLVEESGINDKKEQFTAMYYSKMPLEIDKINFNYSMN